MSRYTKEEIAELQRFLRAPRGPAYISLTTFDLLIRLCKDLPDMVEVGPVEPGTVLDLCDEAERQYRVVMQGGDGYEVGRLAGMTSGLISAFRACEQLRRACGAWTTAARAEGGKDG